MVHLEPGQHLADRAVEVEQPLVGEQADGGRGERLGVGGQREVCVGGDRFTGVEVGVAESFAQRHGVVLDHRDGHARDGESVLLGDDERTNRVDIAHQRAVPGRRQPRWQRVT